MRKRSSSRYSCKQHFALTFFLCWGVHQQSAILKFNWMVCAQILHFLQIQGRRLWIQGSFALRSVRLRRNSWWNYGGAFVWTLFHKDKKMLSRPVGFILYGKLGVDFFSTSELVHPITNVRLRLIKPRPKFFMISDNPNVSLGIVDCSLYVRRIPLKEDYHTKRMEIFVLTLVGFVYMKTLAKTFIIPAKQNQFFEEDIFNDAPFRRIAIAMNKNVAVRGSYADNPFWYQHFDLRQIRIIRGSQPIIDFKAAGKCRLQVTSMKARNFQEDISSIQIDNSKKHYALEFDWTPRRGANENCIYP